MVYRSLSQLDGRNQERWRTFASARATLADQTVHDIFVVEISETGCRIRSHDGALARGASVSLMFDHVGPIAGMIVWQDGSFLGVHFTNPLQPGAVDYVREAVERASKILIARRADRTES